MGLNDKAKPGEHRYVNGGYLGNAGFRVVYGTHKTWDCGAAHPSWKGVQIANYDCNSKGFIFYIKYTYAT